MVMVIGADTLRVTNFNPHITETPPTQTALVFLDFKLAILQQQQPPYFCVDSMNTHERPVLTKIGLRHNHRLKGVKFVYMNVKKIPAAKEKLKKIM